MKVLPVFLSPQWLLHHVQLSSVPLRATALDLAILAGHMLLYPSGITDERQADLPLGAPGGGPTGGPIADSLATPPAGTALSSAARLSKPRGAPPGESPAAHPPRVGQEHRPVVMLHGFVDNRSVFVLLRRSLLRHGWQHAVSLNYSLLTYDIRAAAELLGRHIEEICNRTGHQDVDIVGHSLGGLIARYYVQRLGGDSRVRTLVTLGTPHGGTQIAQLMSAHPLARQMLPAPM